jgi:hypothetical protein
MMCGELGSEKPFGNLPADQVIKDTVNKDTHTSGGTRCFRLKPRSSSKILHNSGAPKYQFEGNERDGTISNKT